MIPFAAAFMIFHFYPLANTVYYAFCYIKGQGRTDPPQFLPSIGEPWYKNFMVRFLCRYTNVYRYNIIR